MKMMKKYPPLIISFKSIRIFLICMVGWISGCINSDLKKGLNESDVVGVWKMSADSLKLLTREGFQPEASYKYTLTLKPDGKCHFASANVGITEGIYMIADGEWKLEHVTTGDSKFLKKNVLNIALNNANIDTIYITNIQFNFTQKRGNLLLWNYFGDPDSCEYIEYERVTESQASKEPMR